MSNKKRAYNILLIIMVVLFVLQIAITHKDLFYAIANSNVTQIMMFGVPVLIVLGALFSLIKLMLKLNNKNE